MSTRTEMTHQDDALGKWVSAALDDDSVCDEMKADVRAWFEQFEREVVFAEVEVFAGDSGRQCCTCAHWDRQFSTDAAGRVRKGFLAACLAPVTIPADAPSALQMQAMNWDGGEQCPAWSTWGGNVVFVNWDMESACTPPVEEDQDVCPNCGADVPKYASCCPECGRDSDEF